MTVRLIESKCPDWVIKALISAKEAEPPDEGREFEYLLPFLLRKRKEARKLQRVREAQQNSNAKRADGGGSLFNKKNQGGAYAVAASKAAAAIKAVEIATMAALGATGAAVQEAAAGLTV